MGSTYKNYAKQSSWAVNNICCLGISKHFSYKVFMSVGKMTAFTLKVSCYIKGILTKSFYVFLLLYLKRFSSSTDLNYFAEAIKIEECGEVG